MSGWRGIGLAANAVQTRSSVDAPQRVPTLLGSKRILTTVYDRDALRPGERRKGPAIVTEYSATTLIPAGRRFWLDRRGNLILEVRPQRRS